MPYCSCCKKDVTRTTCLLRSRWWTWMKSAALSHVFPITNPDPDDGCCVSARMRWTRQRMRTIEMVAYTPYKFIEKHSENHLLTRLRANTPASCSAPCPYWFYFVLGTILLSISQLEAWSRHDTQYLSIFDKFKSTTALADKLLATALYHAIGYSTALRITVVAPIAGFQLKGPRNKSRCLRLKVHGCISIPGAFAWNKRYSVSSGGAQSTCDVHSAIPRPCSSASMIASATSSSMTPPQENMTPPQEKKVDLTEIFVFSFELNMSRTLQEPPDSPVMSARPYWGPTRRRPQLSIVQTPPSQNFKIAFVKTVTWPGNFRNIFFLPKNGQNGVKKSQISPSAPLVSPKLSTCIEIRGSVAQFSTVTVKSGLVALPKFFDGVTVLYVLGVIISLYPIARLHLNKMHEARHQSPLTGWMRSIHTLLTWAFHEEENNVEAWTTGINLAGEYSDYISRDLHRLYTMLQ
ncbi:hypothetical protein DFH08DRAFT_1044180 [Mycena albidolilacea]|uniref:Uncharacterized protein n=1 Tax=Mycena albidolilacea TaxID=1033008 RepID=A0AAD6Z962_9AGAR|nr:hypothetical protein DFH08DRAFT_1044180 [Mycena albidolilacea]